MTDLVPMPDVLDGMPGPADLKTRLLHVVQAGYTNATTERGQVHQPEDVFPLVRRLAFIREQAAAYKTAFAAAEKLAHQLAEEELVEAVGEQDGVPRDGLTVPDYDGGDVRLALDTAHNHTIDLDTLLPLVAAEILTSSVETVLAVDDMPIVDQVRAVVEGDLGTADDLEPLLADLIVLALRGLLELGNFAPQVTKVRAYAQHLARTGNDNLAAVASGSITSTTAYKGVKITRKKA